MSDDPTPPLVFVLFLVFVIGSLWVAISAPCEALGWMPVKDVPARCLEERR